MCAATTHTNPRALSSLLGNPIMISSGRACGKMKGYQATPADLSQALTVPTPHWTMHHVSSLDKLVINQVNTCFFYQACKVHDIVYLGDLFKWGLDWYASPENGSNLSIDIVIPYILVQINFCSYVVITYNLPVIHKQGCFFLD